MLRITRASDDHQAYSGIANFLAKMGNFVRLKSGTTTGHTSSFDSAVELELCNGKRGGLLRRDIIQGPLPLEQFMEGFSANIYTPEVVGNTVTVRSGVQEVEAEGGDYLYLGNAGDEATGTLTLATNMANGDTVTIGTKVYTLQTSLTNVDGNVALGVDSATTAANLAAAIKLGPGAGTVYAAAMVEHPTVSAVASVDTVILTAKAAGTAGNAIATTETSTHASFGAATLTGGSADTQAMKAGLTLDIALTTKLGKIAVLTDASTQETIGYLRGYLDPFDDPDGNTFRVLVELTPIV